MPDDAVPRTVEALRLQPGDVVLVSLEIPIGVEQAKALQGQVMEEFPDHKVVLVAKGIKITVQPDA